MRATQTDFNKHCKKHPEQIVHEIRKLTIITDAGVSIHEVGKHGITRIVNVPFYDKVKYREPMVDRYYTFKGEELHSEIRGRPTVEIEYLKTDEKTWSEDEELTANL